MASYQNRRLVAAYWKRTALPMDGYRFRPALWPTLVTTVLLPVLVSLGVWQLDRAEQKQQRQTLFNERAELPPRQLQHLEQRPQDLEHFTIALSGRYESQYQILLDNQIHRQRSGYHVLTPLRLPGGAVVLVNRGWIPMGASRAELPVAKAPPGIVHVQGRVAIPPAHYFTLESSTPASTEWQTVWQHLDLERYTSEVPFRVYPLTVLLDPASEAGGFVRQWPRYNDHWVARHRAYAFQWFALAVVLLVLFVVMNVTHHNTEITHK